MKRLHSLDALRGVAALAVVVWHWQHFFALSGDFPDGWRRDSQPLFWALKPLYEAGWVAVDLFFALSGFVFFWLYAEAIRSGKIGAGRFALLRLSRLYPLHLVALTVVAGLQWLFWRQTGSYFIFESGDWPRFAASLVMAQQWLPPSEGQFFNGPAWSVSVEVLLYGVFFMACRRGVAGPCGALAIAAPGLVILPFNSLIARGVLGFFLGGATCYAVAWARTRPAAAAIARAVAGAALLLWGLAITEVYWGGLHRLLGPSQIPFLLGFIIAVCPVTIAALALHEHLHGGRWRALSFLGDISYSTYLLHFPLQLVCVLAALRYGWQPADFMQPWVMVVFFVVLIALGAVSHYGFERPMQKWLRSTFARPAAIPETV